MTVVSHKRKYMHGILVYRLLSQACTGKTCADRESFVRGGPNLIAFFFLVDEGIEDPNTAINGPSLNGVSLAGL